jgi:hypothetical protein
LKKKKINKKIVSLISPNFPKKNYQSLFLENPPPKRIRRRRRRRKL